MCELKAAEIVAPPEELEELEELDDPELELEELELFEPELEELDELEELEEPELEVFEPEELEEPELEEPLLDEPELPELEEPDTVDPDELDELDEPDEPDELDELDELEPEELDTDATALVLGALEVVAPVLLSSLSEHAASVTAQRRTIHGFASFMRSLNKTVNCEAGISYAHHCLRKCLNLTTKAKNYCYIGVPACPTQASAQVSVRTDKTRISASRGLTLFRSESARCELIQLLKRRRIGSDTELFLRSNALALLWHRHAGKMLANRAGAAIY